MPKRALNDRIIKSLKPTKSRYEIMDTVVPGFGLRVSERGVKTFILVARYPGSENPTRRSLGEYGELTLEAARTRARHWHDLIRRGIDPALDEERQRLSAQRKQENTFAAVAEDFIKDKLPRERAGRDVEQDIRREFIPVWGKRPIAEMSPLDVRALVLTVKARGTPAMARNLLTTARRMFGWMVDQQVYGLETSPCDRLKPKVLIGEKKPRQRILSDAELRALWKATQAMGYPYGPLVQLLTLTGQRKSEVAAASWSEFDLERKLWIVPPERAKADAAHVVPLSDAVIKILKSLPRFKSGSYLFTTTGGAKPVDGFSRAKRDLDREMAKVLGAPVDSWVLHDARRTFRTQLSAIPGVSDLVRELCIAHTRPGLHKTYDLYAYESEKRFAFDAWAARLRDIVEPPPTNVTRLRRAR
jgi:integrase